jgi:ribosomal protein S18 acetylase RimI-like enzyme
LTTTGRDGTISLAVDELIRRYEPSDEERVVDLSLRAWAPVFASLERVLGQEIFHRLHGDWRPFQARAVREVLNSGDITVWISVSDQVHGFVATKISDPERLIGEVWMLAVDPDSQRRGIGSALTTFATERLRDAGMRVAMIDTGGDAGHAPARKVYEKSDYTLLPIARYWKAL